MDGAGVTAAVKRPPARPSAPGADLHLGGVYPSRAGTLTPSRTSSSRFRSRAAVRPPQPSPPYPPRVPSRGDHAVARDQQAHRVPAHGATDGPGRARRTDPPRDLAVAGGRAPRDGPDGLEDRLVQAGRSDRSIGTSASGRRPANRVSSTRLASSRWTTLASSSVASVSTAARTGRWSRARSIVANASSVVALLHGHDPALARREVDGAERRRDHPSQDGVVGRSRHARSVPRSASPRPTRLATLRSVADDPRDLPGDFSHRVRIDGPLRRHRRDGPRQQRGLPDLLRDRPDPLLDRRDRRADRAGHRGGREPDPRRGPHHLPRAGVPRRDGSRSRPAPPASGAVVHARAPPAGRGPRRSGAARRGQRVDPRPLRLRRARAGRAARCRYVAAIEAFEGRSLVAPR